MARDFADPADRSVRFQAGSSCRGGGAQGPAESAAAESSAGRTRTLQSAPVRNLAGEPGSPGRTCLLRDPACAPSPAVLAEPRTTMINTS
jgi:hypothetical protein